MNDGFIQWIMAGGIITITGFSIATYRAMGGLKDEVNKKIDRSYQRMDEVKEHINNEFTRKDICKILHTQLGEDITDIKTDLKLLLRKNGINQ